ncbi:MAG: MATE family efflux transporter [Clostridia bacterium]|nr:MATE family efflux transporter [Clostridia bacterium]
MQENKMGTMPIGKLIISMSLPMMLSMLVQALYNIVDSIFVAKICENALTAVSLAFPIQNLMISVGSGTSIGVNSLLSKYLGQKRPHDASLSAKNGIFLSLCSFVVFAAVGLIFSKLYFTVQTPDTEIIDFGSTYLFICLVFSFGIFMQLIFERLLLSTGKTVYAMISQLSGAITNIIFDPILIFGLFGFPEMGVAGAAIATVAGQHVACIVGLVLNIKCNHEISISMKGFRPDLRMIKKIYSVGVPSIIMMSIGSVMTFLMNKILLIFSSTAAAVFGVYFKLQSFIFMPIFGMNSGIVPIIAYNYGAEKKERITKTLSHCIFYAVAIMLIGAVIMQLFPKQLLALFEASENMLGIGVTALRIISLSFIFAGYCIILSSAFQALGDGIMSMTVSIIRQLVILVPSAYLLSLTGNVANVWWAFPIAELSSVTLSTIFMVRVYKNKIKKLGEKQNA